MKLGKENEFVASFFDEGLEHRNLIRKIILFTEKLGHTTMDIFPRTDWGAFCMHAHDIESSFLESLLQAPLLKGLPALESHTGSWLVSPVAGHEKNKWTPLKQSLGMPN